MLEFLGKLLGLLQEVVGYPLWKRKERFQQRQRTLIDVRFAINMWVNKKLQPEFKGQFWWLQIRDHINPELMKSMEMDKGELSSMPYTNKHVPYEKRIEALVSEISRLAKKWKVE